MTWLMINVPLMVVFVALWVGIPTWLVLKHPDRKPVLAAAPVVRNLPYRPELSRPELSREDAGYQRVA
jgi:hypothetical protein